MNNAFILSANLKSLLARVCSRFDAELKVVISRPVTFPNSPSVETPNSKISHAAIPNKRGHPILFLSRGKTKKFHFRKNNKLQNRSDFENTSPLESPRGFCPFVSTNLSPITNFESQRYHYSVCHIPVATQHPLSRFQSSARGPALSPTRSFTASTLVLGLSRRKRKMFLLGV